MYYSIKADVLERLVFSEDSSFLCFQRVSFFGESFPCLVFPCSLRGSFLRTGALNFAFFALKSCNKRSGWAEEGECGVAGRCAAVRRV